MDEFVSILKFKIGAKFVDRSTQLTSTLYVATESIPLADTVHKKEGTANKDLKATVAQHGSRIRYVLEFYVPSFILSTCTYVFGPSPTKASRDTA
jgi:hypothetical protein